MAYDQEELNDHKQAALLHGKDGIKKWKWQSKDQAGQLPTFWSGNEENTNKNISPSAQLNNIASVLNNGEQLKRNGQAIAFAEATGRPVGRRISEILIQDIRTGEPYDVNNLPEGIILVQ